MHLRWHYLNKILEIQKFFAPKTEKEDGSDVGVEPEDTLVTVKQFQALEKKVDELIMLQKRNCHKCFGDQ